MGMATRIRGTKVRFSYQRYCCLPTWLYKLKKLEKIQFKGRQISVLNSWAAENALWIIRFF
jgi:hypothetical protein